MRLYVATTLGPKGRKVALDRKFGSPTITHDGVTVAKEIELEDPFENMGAQLLKEAATKTNDIAGDGTTTSTVLAHSIVTNGMKNLAAGFNPMLLKWGIEASTKAVAEEISEKAIEVTTKEDIANVASISAQDRTIGDLIADVMDKVGKDGVITVEESKGLEFETEYVEGMQFDRGYISPYFITNPETMEAVPLENGATGIMAGTSLHPQAAVWFDMRFTMMDIYQVFTDPCPCGMSGFRYKIVGRADDMLKVKGVPVYPAAIEGVIHSMPEELTGAFRIVLDEAPPRVVPPLKLKVEHTEKVREAELPRVESELVAKMHALLKIRPAVTWLAPNTLERTARKTPLLEKTYE